MSILLPLALLAIAVVALLLDRKKREGSYPNYIQWIVAAAVLVAGDLAASKFAPAGQGQSIWIATWLGGLTVGIASLVDSWTGGGSVPMALGAAGASVVFLLPPGQRDPACMAAGAAAGLTALVLGGRLASLTAIVLALSCIVGVMGAHTDTSFVYPSSGAVLFGGIALVGIAGVALKRLVPKVDRVWPVVACAVTIAIAYGAAVKYLSLGEGWTALCIAPLAALIAYWMRDASRANDAIGLMVSAAIWLGLATAAFGLSKSFGVALALVIATGTLIMLNADQALFGSGPMLAVVLTQLFGVLHSDATHSVDVGQHYVLIGLAFGTLLTLLPDEWMQRDPTAKGWRATAASGVWAIVICAAPLLIGVYLAPKGLVGFVAGLGLGGFFGSLKPSIRLIVPALAAGTGCLAALEYGWMGGLTDLSRPDKIHWFVMSGVFVAIAAAVLGALGYRPRSGLKTAEAA